MTLRDYHNQYIEAAGMEEKNGIWDHDDLKEAYYEKIVNQFFTPAIEAAGFSWDVMLREKLTGKIGKLEIGPSWFLPERVIFTYYNDLGLPMDKYKNVSKSVKAEMLTEILKRDYEICTEVKENILLDIMDDLYNTSPTNKYGAGYVEVTWKFGKYDASKGSFKSSNKVSSQVGVLIRPHLNSALITKDREKYTKWLNKNAKKYKDSLVASYEKEVLDINKNFAGLIQWLVFDLNALDNASKMVG